MRILEPTREAGMAVSEDKQAPQAPIEKSATRRDQQDEESRRYRPGIGLSVADLRVRSYWIGFAVGAVAVALVLLVAWPLVDKHVWVHDDRGLGERFSTELHLDCYGCERLAEVLYGHGIHVLANYTYDEEGWASKAEKAFYEGCTDSDPFLND